MLYFLPKNSEKFLFSPGNGLFPRDRFTFIIAFLAKNYKFASIFPGILGFGMVFANLIILIVYIKNAI